jgi:hypothetical protein
MLLVSSSLGDEVLCKVPIDSLCSEVGMWMAEMTMGFAESFEDCRERGKGT